MILHRNAREFYTLDITTTPTTSSTDWEASFDHGTTWVSATDVGGNSAWLLAGGGADASGAVAVISGRVQPLVRLVANPEIVVRDAPAVTYT